MRINADKKLTKRVFTCYLLFCLMSLISLGTGVAIVSYRSSIAAFNDASLSMVSAAKSRLTIATIIDEQDASQKLTEQLAREQNLTYCAIVSPDGSYVAHSSPDAVGKVHCAPLGTRTSIGQIQKIACPKADSSAIVEFSVGLEHAGNNYGTLLIARKRPTAWQNLQGFTKELPFALIGPAILLAVGGIFIHRVVKPVAAVHDQLSEFAASPSIYTAKFNRLPVRDSMSVGWNALVDELTQHLGENDFDQRLENIIQSRQSNQCSSALDSLPDGIAETDLDGQIMFINNAMAALLGVEEKDEVFGKRIDRFFFEDMVSCEPESENESTGNPNNTTENIRNVFDKKMYSRASVAEIARVTPVGERVLRVARNPIATGQAAKQGQVWTIRDVTQQKLAQKARDEFLDSATHELRTPLANIRAYAETLELSDVLEVEQQKEFCNIINSEATRLARFIDELLDVSSIEAGSMQVRKQNTEITRLLEEVIGKVQPLMDKKNLRFETLFAEKLPELEIDKDKFSTCLVNLLGNAAKYTPEGGNVILRATCTANQFMIEVEDTGFGIAEDEVSRVFEKFFRSSDQRVNDETGTGLGLAFANEVARLHNGTLSVESELNIGSKFILSLPMPRKVSHD